MTTYKIVRHFADGHRERIETGLSLQEAQVHCKDPETSSSTAVSPVAVALTKARGEWFDGYDEE
jgi:hypothetical protein